MHNVYNEHGAEQRSEHNIFVSTNGLIAIGETDPFV